MSDKQEQNYGLASEGRPSSDADVTDLVARIRGRKVNAHASCNSVGAATKEVESLSHTHLIPKDNKGRPLYAIEDRGYDTPCWVWQSTTNGRGYGYLKLSGQSWRAHRYAYEAYVGPIPEGLQLDHLCRVTLCCNPMHMEPVTNAENSRRSAKAKLTVEQVAIIKTRDDEPIADLAREYGVNYDTIWNVRTGKRWGDIPAATDSELAA